MPHFIIVPGCDSSDDSREVWVYFGRDDYSRHVFDGSKSALEKMLVANGDTFESRDHAPDVRRFVVSTAITLEQSTVPDSRLQAIRGFFTDPQDSYAVSEMKAMYGPDLEDVEKRFEFEEGQTTRERETVAGFLRGFVPPVVIGHALEGLTAGLLTNEIRLIELPGWLWRGLEVVASKHGWSVSEALSSELEMSLAGLGNSSTFDDAVVMPAYEKVVVPTDRASGDGTPARRSVPRGVEKSRAHTQKRTVPLTQR